MAKVTIEVHGVKAVEKHFKNIAQFKRVKQAIAESAALVELYAKYTFCPVDTGNLRSSIHMEVDDIKLIGRVFTICSYAPYVEFGTGIRGAESGYPLKGLEYSPDVKGQVAQPFMYPALQLNKPRINALIRNAVKEEIH